MGVISSCSDYLNSEKYFKDRLTLEKTFESKDHVEEWLAYGEFYQFNLSSCIRQQNSLTAQFVSFSLSNLANIFYPPQFFQ